MNIDETEKRKKRKDLTTGMKKKDRNKRNMIEDELCRKKQMEEQKEETEKGNGDISKRK